MLEDLDMIESDPGHCRARAYDMVMNGCEVGGGSIRINTMDLQERMLLELAAAVVGGLSALWRQRKGAKA